MASRNCPISDEVISRQSRSPKCFLSRAIVAAWPRVRIGALMRTHSLNRASHELSVEVFAQLGCEPRMSLALSFSCSSPSVCPQFHPGRGSLGSTIPFASHSWQPPDFVGGKCCSFPGARLLPAHHVPPAVHAATPPARRHPSQPTRGPWLQPHAGSNAGCSERWPSCPRTAVAWAQGCGAGIASHRHDGT